jgi:hypothetical protein
MQDIDILGRRWRFPNGIGLETEREVGSWQAFQKRRRGRNTEIALALWGRPFEWDEVFVERDRSTIAACLPPTPTNGFTALLLLPASHTPPSFRYATRHSPQV